MQLENSDPFERYAIIYDMDKTNDEFFIKYYCGILLHLSLGICTVIGYLKLHNSMQFIQYMFVYKI